MGSSTASNRCGVAKLPARSARQTDLATGRTGMASIGTTSSGRAAFTSASSCRLASNSSSSKVQSIRLAIPSSPANSLGSGPDPPLEASTGNRLKTCVVCRFTGGRRQEHAGPMFGLGQRARRPFGAVHPRRCTASRPGPGARGSFVRQGLPSLSGSGPCHPG